MRKPKNGRMRKKSQTRVLIIAGSTAQTGEEILAACGCCIVSASTEKKGMSNETIHRNIRKDEMSKENRPKNLPLSPMDGVSSRSCDGASVCVSVGLSKEKLKSETIRCWRRACGYG